MKNKNLIPWIVFLLIIFALAISFQSTRLKAVDPQDLESELKSACIESPTISSRYLESKTIYFTHFIDCPPDLEGITFETIRSQYGPEKDTKVLAQTYKNKLVEKIIDYNNSYQLDIKNSSTGDPISWINLNNKYLKDEIAYRPILQERLSRLEDQLKKIDRIISSIANIELIQCGLCNTKLNKIFEPVKQDIINALSDEIIKLNRVHEEYLSSLLESSIPRAAFNYFFQYSSPEFLEKEIKLMTGYPLAVSKDDRFNIDLILARTFVDIFLEINTKNIFKVPEIVGRQHYPLKYRYVPIMDLFSGDPIFMCIPPVSIFLLLPIPA